MAILDLPTAPAFTDVEWKLSTKTAVSASVFTGQSSVYIYPNYRWTGTATLPPMKREQAQVWIAFIARLKGRSGMFRMGNPDGYYALGKAGLELSTAICTTSGSANNDAGDEFLYVKLNATMNASGVWKAGDFISFEDGVNTGHDYLHMIVEDQGYGSANSEVSLKIMPPLRADIPAGQTVSLKGATGIFRMASDDVSWTTDRVSKYGITFAFEEVIL